MLDELRSRLSGEYSIPDEIAVNEDTIEDYKSRAVQGKLKANRFGGLQWTKIEDKDHEPENGCMPPVNKLNSELRAVSDSNARQDLERSIFYTMGAAIGLHGEELTEDKAGEPDYDSFCNELYSAAKDSAWSGYWGESPKTAYHEKGNVLKADLTGAAKNVNDIMEELQ